MCALVCWCARKVLANRGALVRCRRGRIAGALARCGDPPASCRAPGFRNLLLLRALLAAVAVAIVAFLLPLRGGDVRVDGRICSGYGFLLDALAVLLYAFHERAFLLSAIKSGIL